MKMKFTLPVDTHNCWDFEFGWFRRFFVHVRGPGKNPSWTTDSRSFFNLN